GQPVRGGRTVLPGTAPAGEPAHQVHDVAEPRRGQEPRGGHAADAVLAVHEQRLAVLGEGGGGGGDEVDGQEVGPGYVAGGVVLVGVADVEDADGVPREQARGLVRVHVAVDGWALSHGIIVSQGGDRKST